MTAVATPSLANLADLIKQFITAVDNLQSCRFTSAAAATIYVYNIVLTFDEEVEYFWTKFKLTFPNLLYISNRYVILGFFLNAVYDLAGFHGPFSDAYCKKNIQVIGFTLAHLGWTSIMTLRVVALWRANKHLVRLIWFLWLCTMTAICVLTYYSYRAVIETMSYNVYIRICAPENNPSIMLAAPIPPTLYELFLTILTLIKTFHVVKATKSTASPLLHVLARDGVIYFVLATVISTTNIIAWHALPGALTYLLLYLYWALLSTFIARLVLNLRKTYYDTRVVASQPMTTGNRMSTNIAFNTTKRGAVRRPHSTFVGVETSEEMGGYFAQIGSRFILGDGELGMDDSYIESSSERMDDIETAHTLETEDLDHGSHVVHMRSFPNRHV